VEVTDQKLIALHYLKSKSGFIVDFIAMTPFEIFSFAISDDFYRERIFSILLLIHLVRAFKVILILHPDHWKLSKWY